MPLRLPAEGAASNDRMTGEASTSMTTTYAERKQRLYERLVVHERTIAGAEPGSLPWSWWSLVLELVEQLPRGEPVSYTHLRAHET